MKWVNAFRRLVLGAVLVLALGFGSLCGRSLWDAIDGKAEAVAFSSVVVPTPTGTPPADEMPVVNPNAAWKVTLVERVSACDNRPGLKMIYVTVLDERGDPLRGEVVRFDTEPSEGIAYDHLDIWGYTNAEGYLAWDTLGKPTRYRLWMGEDVVPLVENLRTDLGNEYCKPLGSSALMGNVPVNRPGIYSYRLEVQKKGE